MYQQGYFNTVLERDICAGQFSKDTSRNWTGRFQLGYGSEIDIGDVRRVVPLELFLLVGVGFYKRPLTCTSTVSIELEEARFEIKDLTASFVEDYLQEDVLRKVFNTGVLKALLGQSLSNTSSARKRSEPDMFF